MTARSPAIQTGRDLDSVGSASVRACRSAGTVRHPLVPLVPPARRPRSDAGLHLAGSCRRSSPPHPRRLRRRPVARRRHDDRLWPGAAVVVVHAAPRHRGRWRALPPRGRGRRPGRPHVRAARPAGGARRRGRRGRGAVARQPPGGRERRAPSPAAGVRGLRPSTGGRRPHRRGDRGRRPAGGHAGRRRRRARRRGRAVDPSAPSPLHGRVRLRPGDPGPHPALPALRPRRPGPWPPSAGAAGRPGGRRRLRRSGAPQSGVPGDHRRDADRTHGGPGRHLGRRAPGPRCRRPPHLPGRAVRSVQDRRCPTVHPRWDDRDRRPHPQVVRRLRGQGGGRPARALVEPVAL